MSQYLRTDNTTKRIVSIEFVTEPDDDNSKVEDTVGKYSSRPGPADRTIDRAERGDVMERGEFKFFIAAMSPEETGNPASVEEDYKRAEANCRGEWWTTFNYAVAHISVEGVMQKITSGGLSGVESDSEPGYFDEIRDDETDDLKGILESLGFDPVEIDTAIANAK